MKTPIYTVSKEEFELLSELTNYEHTFHGKRIARILPETAKEIGENEVVFIGSPKAITFRKRFSTKKVTRSVRFIKGDNSDRYDLKITMYFK